MKTVKTVLTVLSVAVIVILMAGQHSLYGAAGGPNPWGVNSGARGDKALGPLTMYGEVVNPADPQGSCDDGDTQIKAYFFLRLQYAKSEQIFTGVSDSPQCHPSDYAGAETVALHEFLKDVMLQLNPDLVNEYENCNPDPFGEGLVAPCPNILRSFKDVQDSEGDFNDPEVEALLSVIGDVELKIPR